MIDENKNWLSANITDNTDLSGLKSSKSTVRKAGAILKQEDITED